MNGKIGTITFETPVARVQFFAATIVTTSDGGGDGTFEVYDTEDNLLFSEDNLGSNIIMGSGLPHLTFDANELGAPGGIGKILLIDDPLINPLFSSTGVDNFGFTPVGAPGFEGGGDLPLQKVLLSPPSPLARKSHPVHRRAYPLPPAATILLTNGLPVTAVTPLLPSPVRQPVL